VTFDIFREKLETYILRELKEANDVLPAVRELTCPKSSIDAQEPKDLSEAEMKSAVKTMILQQEVKEFLLRKKTIQNNLDKIYGLVWGQCSQSLQSVMKGDVEYKEKSVAADCVWLLQNLKKITSGIDKKANPLSTYCNAVSTLFSMRQGSNEANDVYMRRFNNNILTLELSMGINAITPKGFDEYPTGNETEVMQLQESVKAMLFLKRSDDSRYDDLKKRLEESAILGRDEYPKTVSEMYDLLVRTNGLLSEKKWGGKKPNHRPNVMFAQKDIGKNMVPGRNGKIIPLQCYNCQAYGHVANNCPEERQERGKQGIGCAQIILTQQGGETQNVINHNWILLDTCSTASVCSNIDLVNDIQDCDPSDVLHIVTNGGTQSFKKTGTLKVLPLQVHVNPSSLANILSLKDVASIPGIRITMDTEVERAIHVHVDDNKVLKFNECDDGLYYYDVSTSNFTKPLVNNYSFLSTVTSNKRFFTAREVQGADKARKLQEYIGWPGDSTFKDIIKNNQVTNCGITIDDITRAAHIYGPATATIKGKMHRVNPNDRKIQKLLLPPPVLEHHRDVTLHIDYFFVNKMPFLHTKSEKLNFLTVQTGKNRTKRNIIEGINIVMNTL
jgi:hypothetical protein